MPSVGSEVAPASSEPGAVQAASPPLGATVVQASSNGLRRGKPAAGGIK